MTVLGAAVGLTLFAGDASQPVRKGKKPAGTKQNQKVRPAPKPAKYIEVTGSRIPVRVTPGQSRPPTMQNVMVIDPEAAENKGYVSVMEMLSRNTSISRGIRGY